jgi:hypothetical protein
MTAFEQAILGMDVLALFFCFVTLVYIKRNREYERMELENGLSALLFGVFFLFISLLVHALVYAEKNFHDAIVLSLPEAATYAGYLMNIADLALVPLFAVCFFVALLFVYRQLAKEKRADKKAKSD